MNHPFGGAAAADILFHSGQRAVLAPRLQARNLPGPVAVPLEHDVVFFPDFGQADRGEEFHPVAHGNHCGDDMGHSHTLHSPKIPFSAGTIKKYIALRNNIKPNSVREFPENGEGMC